MNIFFAALPYAHTDFNVIFEDCSAAAWMLAVSTLEVTWAYVLHYRSMDNISINTGTYMNMLSGWPQIRR